MEVLEASCSSVSNSHQFHSKLKVGLTEQHMCANDIGQSLREVSCAS